MNTDFDYKGWKNVYRYNEEAAEQHPKHNEYLKRFKQEQSSVMDLQKKNKKFMG